jgi:hypothetical protein
VIVLRDGEAVGAAPVPDELHDLAARALGWAASELRARAAAAAGRAAGTNVSIGRLFRWLLERRPEQAQRLAEFHQDLGGALALEAAAETVEQVMMSGGDPDAQR